MGILYIERTQKQQQHRKITEISSFEPTSQEEREREKTQRERGRERMPFLLSCVFFVPGISLSLLLLSFAALADFLSPFSSVFL